jgi:diaminopimelate decarboxylase
MNLDSCANATLTGHPYFQFRNNVLHAEDVPLDTLTQQVGTPLYVYSRAALRAAWQTYRDAMGQRQVLVCYGMKANSNLAVLQEFQRQGAGFDIVSGGELKRALAVGADPAKIVFSGVGKLAWEIRAALAADIKCFNVESVAELYRLAELAQGMGRRARVSLRLNPDIDAQTHPYISTGLKENKFGIDMESALSGYRQAASMPSLHVVGVDCHIGSQIIDIHPYFAALEKLLDLIQSLAKVNIPIHHIDLGGGLGIRYRDEHPPTPKALLDQVFERLHARHLAHLQLVLEPGRSLVGNAGLLLTTVQYLKCAPARNFAIVDAAMNDFLRPALYQSYHGVLAVAPRVGSEIEYDVVGPVCESADWLALQRKLVIEPGDVLAVESAGAYGMTMASNYNTRARAAEVMVDGDKYYVVRPRETLDALLQGESTLPTCAL